MKYLLFTTLLFISSLTFGQKTGTVEIKGKTYRTVEIGNQTWLAEDLKFDVEETTFKNGTCFYTWEAAQKADSLIDGWRLPTDEEFEDLLSNVKRKKYLLKGRESNFNAELLGQVRRLTKKGVFKFEDMPSMYYFSSTRVKNSKRSVYSLWFLNNGYTTTIKIYPFDIFLMKSCIRLVKDDKK